MGFSGGGGELLDGSVTLSKLDSNVFRNIDKKLQENFLNDLINSIASGSTLNNYDDLFGDIFSDSDGVLNTIDTGNTTATFDTNLYKNPTSSIAQDLTESSNSGAGYILFKTILDINSKLVDVTNEIKNDTGTADASCYIEFYYTDETHESSTPQSNATTSYVEKTYICPTPNKTVDYIEVYIKNDAQTQISEKNTYCNAYSNGVIQTNVISIPANPTGHQVFCHNEIQGSGTINYRISFDNKETWISGQELNTKNTEVHEGSQACLELDLNGTDLIEVSDFVLKLFYD